MPNPKEVLAQKEGTISRGYRSAAPKAIVSGMSPEHAWSAPVWAISALASAARPCRGTELLQRLNLPRGTHIQPGTTCPAHRLNTRRSERSIIRSRNVSRAMIAMNTVPKWKQHLREAGPRIETVNNLRSQRRYAHFVQPNRPRDR